MRIIFTFRLQDLVFKCQKLDSYRHPSHTLADHYKIKQRTSLNARFIIICLFDYNSHLSITPRTLILRLLIDKRIRMHPPIDVTKLENSLFSSISYNS